MPSNKTGRRLYGFDNPCSTAYDGKLNPAPFKTFNNEVTIDPASSTPLRADHTIAGHVERSIGLKGG